MSKGTQAFSAQFSVGIRLNDWKMKPMFVARNLVTAAFFIRSSRVAEDLHAAGVGVQGAGDDAEQRGLAAAAGADEHDDLSVTRVETRCR